MDLVGKLRGELPDMDEGEENEEYVDDNEDDEMEQERGDAKPKTSSKRGFGGIFNVFKGLVGSRTITRDQLSPILDKMRVFLIEKNVAAEIAEKLCTSVGEKLEGKTLGTFEGEYRMIGRSTHRWGSAQFRMVDPNALHGRRCFD